MKSIEERIEEIATKHFPFGNVAFYPCREALRELAADLQAEKERSINALNDTLSLNLGQLMEAQNRLAEKEKEVAELMEKSRALVEKLREIHGDPRYQAVWFCAANHGIPYTGPKYDKELEQLEQLLTRLGGSHDQANQS